MTAEERAEYILARLRNGIITGRKENMNDLLVLHFKEIEEGMKDRPPKCEEHPKYQAKRRPRLACEACWKMWILK